jgi:chromosome segregation ATPase
MPTKARHPARAPRRRPVDAAGGRSELRELQATVAALRDELERARIDEETRIQTAMTAAHEEITILRDTIQTLRDEMDRARLAAVEERDTLAGDWRRQLQEAQSTVVSLRAQLEQR